VGLCLNNICSLDAAIKQLINLEKIFTESYHKIIFYKTRRLSIIKINLPGTTPSLMINAGYISPMVLILDLADSVAPDKI
jgi:citrate lyase subunit beta/citryl-CoA lyase